MSKPYHDVQCRTLHSPIGSVTLFVIRVLHPCPMQAVGVMLPPRQEKIYMCLLCKKQTKSSWSRSVPVALACPCNGLGPHRRWSMCLVGETEITTGRHLSSSKYTVSAKTAALEEWRGYRGPYYTSKDFYPPQESHGPIHAPAASEVGDSIVPGYIPDYIAVPERASYAEAVEAAKRRIHDQKPTTDGEITHAILIFLSTRAQITEALMDTDAVRKQVR